MQKLVTWVHAKLSSVESELDGEELIRGHLAEPHRCETTQLRRRRELVLLWLGRALLCSLHLCRDLLREVGAELHMQQAPHVGVVILDLQQRRTAHEYYSNRVIVLCMYFK